MIIDPLKIFVAVVKHKNFSRAADELYLSQPSVSLQIRNLESELGTKLINRSPKHLELTQSGKILYQYAKQILLSYDKAKQEIDQLKNIVTGSLKIGASFTIGEYILPHLMTEFALQYPNVDIEVSIANTEEITQGVRTNLLDIGLIEGEVNYSDLDVNPFSDDEMILVVPKQHALARLPIVTAEHLQQQVWILRESGSGTRAFSDQLIQDWGLNVKRTYVFGSSEGVKQAVMAGLGIALVSYWIVRKELDAEQMTAVRIKEKRLLRSFYLIKPKVQETSKALDILIDKIKTFERDEKQNSSH